MEKTLMPPAVSPAFAPNMAQVALNSVNPLDSLRIVPLDSLYLVPLALIDRVDQPRNFKDSDVSNPDADDRALAEQIAQERALGGGIEASGLLQPVLLRPNGERFKLVAGERRYRATLLLGLSDIPAVIKEMSDSDAWRSAIVENVQRKDLSPIEEGRAFLTWMENDAISMAEIGVAIGRSESYVRQRLDSLRLADDLRRMISSKPQTTRAARELSAVPEIDRRPIIQALCGGASYTSQQQAIKDVRQRVRARNQQSKMERDNEPPKPRSNGQGAVRLPRVPYKELVEKLEQSIELAIDVCANVSPQGDNKRLMQSAVDRMRARIDHLETLI